MVLTRSRGAEPLKEDEEEALCLWPAPKYWRPVILWPFAFLPRFDLMLTVTTDSSILGVFLGSITTE